jgi:acetyl esterase
MSIDPQVQQWLSESASLPPINQLPVADARRNMLTSSRQLQPIHNVLDVRDLVAIGPEGSAIPLRHYAPTSGAAGVLVYFHGGGWVIGSRDTHDAEDCYQATAWVADNLDAVQGKPGELFVAGDSAGGNLAAVTCLLARERQGPKINGQILVYPITDCDFNTPSYLENSKNLHLTRDMMAWFWDQYLPDASERSHWMASPLQATDLSDLPAAFVLTAEYDPLRDEGEAYARRLSDAGVATRFRRYDGMIHGFVRRMEWTQAREALEDCAVAIQDIADGNLI